MRAVWRYCSLPLAALGSSSRMLGEVVVGCSNSRGVEGQLFGHAGQDGFPGFGQGGKVQHQVLARGGTWVRAAGTSRGWGRVIVWAGGWYWGLQR